MPLTKANDGRPGLVLVHESETACRKRLEAAGFAEPHVSEITSYLAQSTDMEPEFERLGSACAGRGLAFRPVALDDAPAALAGCDPARTLVWTLTDGIAYFRGGVAPALARLHGLRTIGADDSLFALCQDKFRSGSVLRALGLPAPAGGLARNGEWIVLPPASERGYFVKPNRLGAKIGIWEDSRCATPEKALELSRRIYACYRDDAIVQPYVEGRNVRASFLAVEPGAGMERLGVFFVDSGSDFQTMADSLSLYGDTGTKAKREGSYAEPLLAAVAATQPDADRAIRDIAARLVSGLGLADVFSVDLRVERDETVHLIEFEVCPGLPCFDFRAYCRECWGMELAEAMAAAVANRLAGSLGAGEADRRLA
jgi:D-alanine-D-alanine ligase